MILPCNTTEVGIYLKCSCFVVLSTFFAIICMKIVPVSIFAFIFNLKPVLVLFFGFCIGQETLTRKKFGFILLSFLGTGLIVDSSLFAGCFHWLLGTSPTPSAANNQIAHGEFASFT